MKADTSSFTPATRGGVSLFIIAATLLTLALVSISCGVSRVQMLAEVTSAQKRYSVRLQPAVRTWIDDQAMKLARFSAEEDGVREAMESRFRGQNLSEDGRDVLRFLTVARAVDISNQRVQLFEEHQKAIRASQDKIRELLPRLEADIKKNTDLHELAPAPPECAVYRDELRKLGLLIEKTPSWTTVIPREILFVADVKAIEEDLQGKLDGMNELSEMTSLRLQMMMDRRSKFIETLSNIMKKISTTQETIVQNLK